MKIQAMLCFLAIGVSQAAVSLPQETPTPTDRCQSDRVTTAQVEELIARVGIVAAMRELSEEPRTWEEVLANIAAGDAAWLGIAGRLEAGADGGPGLQLVLAVQDALPKSAEHVLGLVKNGDFAVLHVCGGYGPTQMEDRRPKSKALELIRKRQDAVRAVGEDSLATVKAACLDQLEKLEQDVREKTPWPPTND